MLWQKAWLETRWRFLVGVVLVLFSAAETVLIYPQILKFTAVPVNIGGEIGRQIRESIELARSFRGYVWSEWFRQNLAQLATLFAVQLGTATIFPGNRGVLFTLSLPVSRKRLIGTRAAAGLGELFAIAFIPSLSVVLLAPAIGRSYAVGDALVHGLCVFVATSLFFSLAFLLSTAFDDAWRPLLITLGIAFVLAIVDKVPHIPFSVFRVMSGEAYFRTGALPWISLLVTAAISAAMLATAVTHFARRDF